MKTFLYAATLALGLVACTSSPAPAPTVVAPAQAALDTTCRPPMHQCPKCGTQGGYYCGSVCMDCPVLLNEESTLAQSPLALSCN